MLAIAFELVTLARAEPTLKLPWRTLPEESVRIWSGTTGVVKSFGTLTF